MMFSERRTRFFSSFNRSVALTEVIEPNRIKPNYENRILKVNATMRPGLDVRSISSGLETQIAKLKRFFLSDIRKIGTLALTKRA